MWIFGYGSIMWKVDFPYRRKLIGYIKGYVRRFYQGSTDHRGTPENPGRVVTLLPSNDPEDVVWGVAFELPSEQEDEIMAQLDYREKGGFTRVSTTFYPTSAQSLTEPFELVVYIAKEGNKNYLGPAPARDIARQIYFSVGPSGPNRDYLLNLAQCLRQIVPGHEDSHVAEIEREFLNLENKQHCAKNSSVSST